MPGWAPTARLVRRPRRSCWACSWSCSAGSAHVWGGSARVAERTSVRRGGPMTVLLGAAAPVLVVGGLVLAGGSLGGTAGDRAPAQPTGATVAGAPRPADPQQVGWWSQGARPGASTGSAVLTGHTVHTGGGAFDDLEELDAGDEVVVRTDRGALGYDVVSVEVLGKGELDRRSADVFEQSGPARLVLVTCEDWDGTEYLSNVVVTARPSA